MSSAHNAIVLDMILEKFGARSRACTRSRIIGFILSPIVLSAAVVVAPDATILLKLP
jgi:hypothetical protein